MYTLDQSWDGFEWINANDSSRSIFSFIRHSADRKSNLLFVINFTPVARDDYQVGVPQSGNYKLVLNSEERFGGTGQEQPATFKAVKGESDGQPYHLEYKLPPYGVAVFKYAERKPAAKNATAEKTAESKPAEKKTTAKKTAESKPAEKKTAGRKPRVKKEK